MKTNYKLHLSTSKDSLRPVMQHILLTKDNFVATDAHILAVVPAELILSDASIECIPDEGLLINSAIWKSIYNADEITVYSEGGIFKILGHFRNKPTMEFKIELNGFELGTIGTFPKWEQVIPQEVARQETLMTGINAKLLMNLSDALNASNGFKLEFNGSNKGILCTPISKDAVKPYGLIMPIKID
jgi:hypothetical protein